MLEKPQVKKKEKKYDPFARKKGYLFSPRKLYFIARAAGRLKTEDIEEKFEYIVNRLKEEYPGHIEYDGKWVFNNAGGAIGQMTFLHGSLREYIIIFGSSMRNEGHSGQYKADVFDYVFDGMMHCELEGRFERKEFGPGSAAFLPSSKVKHYSIEDHAWMLEYGRGIPTVLNMLPFGLMDNFTSTLDFMSVFRTLSRFGRHVLRSLFKKGKDWDVVLKWVLMAIGFIVLPILGILALVKFT
jgi:hypothetical protein